MDCFVHFDGSTGTPTTSSMRRLIMTKLVTPSLRGTKQSRYKRLNLDCFVPRNDGDLYRHHSFLQGIFPMPGAYNDETRNPVIARWLLSEVEIHEAIQKKV